MKILYFIPVFVLYLMIWMVLEVVFNIDITFYLAEYLYAKYFNVLNGVQLSFDDFEKFYYLAPDKYKLEDVYVRYDYEFETRQFIPIYRSKDIVFKDYVSFVRYKFFRRRIIKENEIENKIRSENKNMKEYLEAVQKDIDDKIEEAEFEI